MYVDRVRDRAERAIERDRAEAPRPLRHLLDASAGHRRAEQVALAAGFRGEVDVAAVGRPPRVARLEVPLGREVDRLSAVDAADEQIARAAMIQLLLDDHVGAELPRVRQVPTV